MSTYAPPNRVHPLTNNKKLGDNNMSSVKQRNENYHGEKNISVPVQLCQFWNFNIQASIQQKRCQPLFFLISLVVVICFLIGSLMPQHVTGIDLQISTNVSMSYCAGTNGFKSMTATKVIAGTSAPTTDATEDSMVAATIAIGPDFAERKNSFS